MKTLSKRSQMFQSMLKKVSLSLIISLLFIFFEVFRFFYNNQFGIIKQIDYCCMSDLISATIAQKLWALQKMKQLSNNTKICVKLEKNLGYTTVLFWA